MKRDTSWDFSDRKTLMRHIVGLARNTEPNLEAIENGRVTLANFIRDTLALHPKDVVLDVGSGPGYIAKAISPHVAKIHCADISKDCLDLCKETVAGLDVDCHLIPFANLTELHGKDITAIYASAVFVHFNPYDAFLYMREFANVLDKGGRVFLDYKNADVLYPDDPYFARHADVYKNDRSSVVRLLNYNSTTSLQNMAHTLGFSNIPLGNVKLPGNVLHDHHVLVLYK